VQELPLEPVEIGCPVLAIAHPVSGEQIDVESPLPGDLSAALTLAAEG
jgi:hypothetical protein